MKILKAAVIASSVLMTSGVGAQARDLTVVSWGGNFQDAQRKIFFEAFAKETGKPVLDESWEGGYGVLQAKVKAGVPNWDVVEVEAEELALGCADGIYEKIDWQKMGGKEAYLPAAVSDCGVGNIVWSTGLSYDGAKLAEGPKTWADFWDTKKFPGKRGLRKGPKYALEFALMADGVPADQVYDVLSGEGGVDRAFKKLDELKADIIWWDAGAQPLQLLSSGQVVMTSAYNGRISGINRSEGKKFGFVFPGSVYAIDSWVILKDSPNKDAGMDFIAYASKAENQAKLPEYIAYGLPNLGATKLVPEQFQKELPTTEENLNGAVALDVDFWTDNSEELTQRFNAWLAQ
ncbi:extracellular solute-binding protein [Sinorhizobium meliloti]|uniref:ABC transporter substrate-binding protein n=1 Tax=Rhizobium meliloti TaxID=382 RepID=UPI000402986A|nr:ABC transporter substrate-binding protein [Sinorhizobium meliloti]MDW9356871.1 extracellular solute-binding protein [Sinorhizobium meliloti]MDW9414969.1 extracellular solute-binding protein [Sinorhizobium meliloti]MDW9460057.1 extracellular solute-binding protein [Sinorhizobium meliloti]MDW9479841.1 extracellular solute-binding protein [Sinorhizobium meliloti]MDW9510170.1 extracellular solute-binding protein [Sinorhizobium meliloti]